MCRLLCDSTPGYFSVLCLMDVGVNSSCWLCEDNVRVFGVMSSGGYMHLLSGLCIQAGLRGVA